MNGKRRILSLFALIWITFLYLSEVLSQPASQEEPIVKLGEITFRVREIGSSPSTMNILELYIEVLNKSRATTVPSNSIKVLVTPKEILYAGEKPAEEFTPASQEVILSIPLPPLTGRVLIFGLTLPREKVQSITFDIQMNPPEGDKKMVKWEGS